MKSPRTKCSDIIIDLGAGTVRGGGHSSLVSSMPPGVVHGPDDTVSAPLSSGRGNYLPTQSQASYHSASSSPSARRPSSAFDGVNEEANVRANAAVVPGYAGVRASAAMTDDIAALARTPTTTTLSDNNDDGDDGNFDDTLSEILGISPGSQLLPTLIWLLVPSTTTSIALALHFSLHSLTSHLPPPLLLLLLLLGSPCEIQEFSLS